MDFNTLTDDEIRAKLTEAGIPVGPIVGMILYFSLLTIYLFYFFEGMIIIDYFIMLASQLDLHTLHYYLTVTCNNALLSDISLLSQLTNELD